MTQLLPSASETLVVPYAGEEIVEKLRNAVDSSYIVTSPEQYRTIKFTGWVTENRFSLSLRLRRLAYFNPKVTGTVESTRNGSIVFIQYSLFPITRMYLIFWSLFTVLAGVFTSRQYHSLYYLAWAFLLILFMHWVAWSNFKIQVKPVREMLLRILNAEE